MSGRKGKFNEERVKMIIDAINAGNYNDVAAQYAGIDVATFYRWLVEGENAQSGAKHEFYEAVKIAQARAEVRNVAIIETAAPRNWQAAAWWLERKNYDRWGRKERTELVGEGGGPVLLSMAELVKKAAEEDSNDGG